MVFLAILIGPQVACSASGDVRHSQNTGDQIAARLRIGMTNGEVDAAIGDTKKYLWEDTIKFVESDRHIFRLYKDNYYPKDVLDVVEVGTPFRLLAYWTNYAGRNAGTLRLFFDNDSQRLRGWVNTASLFAREKFMHERITSQLKWSEGGAVKGMTHLQVRALVGEPTEIILPPKITRSLYEDHFWVSGTAFFAKQKIEVYSYLLDSGERRRVYLLYYPAADELNGWGYDHAWEEAERYQRAQGAQTN